MHALVRHGVVVSAMLAGLLWGLFVGPSVAVAAEQADCPAAPTASYICTAPYVVKGTVHWTISAKIVNRSDPGTTTPGNTSSQGGTRAPVTCTISKYQTYTTIQSVPCQTVDGWYSQADNCYYTAAPANNTPDIAAYTELWAGHTPPDGALYIATSYTAAYLGSYPSTFLAPPVTKWRATPPPGITAVPTSKTLAYTALGELALPAPTTGRLPDFTANGGAGVVNAHTWFWTTPATVATLTPPRTVAGPVWAQIVATPSFTVTPGDGTGAIPCPDGGTQPAADVNLATTASPSQCEHIYRITSAKALNQKFTATYSTIWRVSFTGSDTPTPHTLLTITRTTTDTFPVTEIQSLNIPGR